MTAKISLVLRFPLLAILGVALCAAPLARADLVISVTSAAVAAGSIDNAVDVSLTNTGTADITVGAFFFGLLPGDPAVTFIGASTSTSKAYIFAPDSLFGPEIATTVGPTLLASDVAGSGDVVAAGATVGLGHVLFDVASNVAGPFTISLSQPETSLADPLGGSLAIGGLRPGQISITPASSVAEPPPVWPVAGPLLLFGILRRRSQPQHE